VSQDSLHDRRLLNQLSVLPLASTHPIDRLSLELHHPRCGERPTWRASLLLNGDEFASLDSTIDLLLDVLDARVADRALQRVTQDRALLDDGFAFEIPIACERHCPPSSIRRLTLPLNVMRAMVLGLVDDLRRLVPKLRGEFLVTPPHLVMREISERSVQKRQTAQGGSGGGEKTCCSKVERSDRFAGGRCWGPSQVKRVFRRHHVVAAHESNQEPCAWQTGRPRVHGCECDVAVTREVVG